MKHTKKRQYNTEKYDPRKNEPVSYSYLDHWYYSDVLTGKLYAKRDIVLSNKTIKKGTEVGKNKSGYVVVYLPNSTSMKRANINLTLKLGRMIKDNHFADHINSVVNDDRWDNLQELDDYLNMSKQRVILSKRKLPVGVYLTRHGKYLVKFSFKKVVYNLGTYDTIIKAVEVREKKREEIFAEYKKQGLVLDSPTFMFDPNVIEEKPKRPSQKKIKKSIPDSKQNFLSKLFEKTKNLFSW